jgi:hypothetical protein
VDCAGAVATIPNAAKTAIKREIRKTEPVIFWRAARFGLCWDIMEF